MVLACDVQRNPRVYGILGSWIVLLCSTLPRLDRWSIIQHVPLSLRDLLYTTQRAGVALTLQDTLHSVYGTDRVTL